MAAHHWARAAEAYDSRRQPRAVQERPAGAETHQRRRPLLIAAMGHERLRTRCLLLEQMAVASSPGARMAAPGSGMPPPATPSPRRSSTRSAVSGAQFSPDESRILTWSGDGTARLWDAATGDPAHPAAQARGRGLRAPSSSADETRVLTWSDDGSARLWDSANGDPTDPAAEARRPGSGRPVQRRRGPRPHLERRRQRPGLG